jgi:hypothetical protein
LSRTGCCYDKAAMERFVWSLKHEWTNHLQALSPGKMAWSSPLMGNNLLLMVEE